jgi:hypothetical protein
MLLAIAYGTTRFVFLAAGLAFKIGRGRRGLECNQRELSVWRNATPERRQMLCPIVGSLPFGMLVIQIRAVPITEDEARTLRETYSFPDWNYIPGEPHGDPTEPKASDWGRLNGRLVAVDYGMRSGWE